MARLVLLPPHDPQFRRNRERVVRDAERELILLDWDLGDDDSRQPLRRSALIPPPVPVRRAGSERWVVSAHGRRDDDRRYLNRELSWLDFNARVLALAEDADVAAARAGQVPAPSSARTSTSSSRSGSPA